MFGVQAPWRLITDVACISDISSCRFILPLKIGEQESKAQIHLLQILRLARALDRTLVLPNVGASRLSACGNWDFGTYYDIEKLTSGKTVPLVKIEEFKKRTRNRHPTAQLITIDSKKDRPVSQNSTVISRHNINFDIDNNRDLADSKFIPCLSTEFPRLDLSAFSPINIYPSEAGQAILKNASLGPLIVSALDDPDVQALASRISTPPAGPTTADVLLLDWNLRHPAFPTFPEAELSLEYSPHLIRLASSMAPPGSYLAVHWRMETIPPEKLPQCAHSLVERLSDILHEPAIGDGITTVWLATDYPHSDGHIDVVSKSSTFRNITPFHHTAMSIFQSAFLPRGPLETFNFTGLSEKLHSPRNGDDVLLQDSGVRGILDKVIAMRAALFVSGGNGCGKTSSYTKQIVQARRGYGKEVRNVVDMFG